MAKTTRLRDYEKISYSRSFVDFAISEKDGKTVKSVALTIKLARYEKSKKFFIPLGINDGHKKAKQTNALLMYSQAPKKTLSFYMNFQIWRVVCAASVYCCTGSSF
jgi:hypothetical protein